MDTIVRVAVSAGKNGPDRTLTRHLQPGDVLQLEPGRYAHGLRVHDLSGAPGRPVVINGPGRGSPAVFEARQGHNTVSIANASYVEIRNLVLDGRGLEVDAVKAERNERLVHHIVLENLAVVRHGPEQQTVGIATAAPAAFWIIRNNVIIGAGTGLYLGGSDGSAPFVGGTIEGNVVVATTGYNLQIKHQKARPTAVGLPNGRSRTVIRGNVFAKSGNSAVGPMARPNVLLGHFSLEGPGSEDEYQVEGNLFYGNPTESLLQAEGHVSVKGNLLVNPVGNGVSIQPHNDLPRRITIRDNFIAAKGFGLRVIGAHPAYSQVAEGNDVYAQAQWPVIETGTVTDPADATAVEALTGWLGRAQNAKGAALQKALRAACRPRRVYDGDQLPPMSVIPPIDPACVASQRLR